MQNNIEENPQAKPKVNQINLQYLRAPLLSKDTFKLAVKCFFSILLSAIAYLVCMVLFTADNDIFKIVVSLAIVGVALLFQYSSGITKGVAQCTFAEILFINKQEGKLVSTQELNKAYNPLKGIVAVLIGASPFILIAIVYAFITSYDYYSLGALPTWLNPYRLQGEFADALSYYSTAYTFSLQDFLKIIVRLLVFPFVSIADIFGKEAILWVERFSPILLLIAPMGYGIGYFYGENERKKILKGILIGDKKKKRTEKKARKARQQSKSPERLI